LLRLVLFPALALLAAGCGGINTSQTISPATFFLPGLLQADPPKPAASPRGMDAVASAEHEGGFIPRGEPASPAFAEPASTTQVALAR
jgi:hypothetical protein